MSAEPPDSGSPFWAVAIGLLAGAIWRAPRWFSKDGLKKGLLFRDICAIGVLGIVSMVICRIFGLTGEYAALAGVAVTIVGVDAIRKYAMDVFAQWMQSKYNITIKPEPEGEE